MHRLMGAEAGGYNRALEAQGKSIKLTGRDIVL